MSEHDGELRRLRAADPVDQAAIPSSDAPGPRALRERIMMSQVKQGLPRMRMVFAAAAVALVAAGAAIVISRGGQDEPKAPVANDSEGPITSGGAASCVEMYSLQTLANRAIAFDGTVTAVDGDEVTFTVNESFRGVDDRSVALMGASTIGGITSAGDAVSLEPGTRLLVSGDGGFAWACGFTRPYDADVAADWRSALKG